jgi:hypothetical protein
MGEARDGALEPASHRTLAPLAFLFYQGDLSPSAIHLPYFLIMAASRTPLP